MIDRPQQFPPSYGNICHAITVRIEVAEDILLCLKAAKRAIMSRDELTASGMAHIAKDLRKGALFDLDYHADQIDEYVRETAKDEDAEKGGGE